MTVQTPFVTRNGLITIATVDYSVLIPKARLVPNVDIQTFVPVVPSGVVQDVGEPVWTWEVTMADDWTASTGIAAILFGEVGTSVVVTMQQKSGTGNSLMTFNIVAIPMPFGLDSGSFNQNDLSFPVIGQPVLSTSV